jgi:PAS domain S-box-containing protein
MKKFDSDDILTLNQQKFSKNLHNLLLNNSNAVYTYNFASKKYSYFSSNIEILIGYTRDELNEIGFSSIVERTIKTNKDIHNLSDHSGNLIEEHYGKYLVKTKNGQLKWLEDISFAFKNGNSGNYDYSVGVLRDITEFNNLVYKLYDEKVYLDSVLELTEIIFVLLDKNDDISFVNSKGLEILGYEYKDLIGKSILSLIPGNKRKRDLFGPLQFFNEYKTFETSITTKYGEEKIISWQFKEEFDKNGTLEFKVCSGRDITFVKKQERINKEILGILEASNTNGKLNELYQYIHSSVSRLMPANNFYIALYDKDEDMITFPYLVDQFEDYAPPKKYGRGLTEYVLRKGKPILVNREKDIELIKKKEVELIGTPSAIWLGVPLKIQSNTIGVVAVQDYENEYTYTEKEKNILEVISYTISRAIERKRVEEEKNILIEQLSESNKSKDKLFSLVSHDLRSPFNSLLGFSKILTTEFDSLTHEEMKEYLNIIYETSKNLFSMTNNLLHYSRFQLGNVEYKPSCLDLNSLIEKNVKVLKINALRKKLNVTQDLAEGVKIYADEEMMSSAVQNLLSNAIKFTNKGGEIAISSKVVEDENGHQLVKLKIKDSGIGISNEILYKVFVEQLQSTPGTDKEFGTGLGLLLVNESVRKNNGTIEVESELGKGTAFIITMPVYQETYQL